MMSDFKYKNFLEQQKMTLEELNKYYRDLRKYEYEQDLPIKGIEVRKKLYPLVSLFLKIDKLISSRSVTIVGDKRVKNDKPKIYACTHVARYDIESAIEAIGESAWFIMGDPGEVYRNFEGLMLRIIGVSWFDMGKDPEFKFDAHTVNARQIKILKQGGNELCFPEQAWHMDPQVPVGEIHPGIVRRAIKTGAEIVPIAIEQYKVNNIKKYYVNIGSNVSLEGCSLEQAEAKADELRSLLMGLKWDILEKYGNVKRDDLPEDWYQGYNEFIDSIMCDTENGYTIEEINKTKYQKPNAEKRITREEANAYLFNLNLNKNNAFLAREVIKEKKIQLLKNKK